MLRLLPLALCLMLVAAPLRAADDTDAGAAVAQGSGPLETRIVIELLEVEEGEGGRESRRWVPPWRLRAGDELHYTVRVTNPGTEPVTDVVVTKRLPYGVQYQRGSATGPACDVLFSRDGGTTFHPPERTPSGSSRRTTRGPAPPPTPTADYTHVRWVLQRPLRPGATALLRFRATFT
jgi:uncharacterized repeat protein (TIGR01451 family)